MKLIFLVLHVQLIHTFELDFGRLHFIFVHGSTPQHNTRYTAANLRGILNHPKFSFHKKTALFCHGWFDNFESIGTQAVASAYIKRDDHNFIVFDWGAYDATLLPVAVQRSEIIAPYVGRALLVALFENGLSPHSFHCVGHSIGAHICGAAGREVIYKSGGRFKFQRITALDPARQYFHHPPFFGTPLTPVAAHFVDVIHTDGLNRGTPHRVGHADFYPNGGLFQASCPPVDFNYITGFCSHWLAWLYYAHSLINEHGYRSESCNSYSEYQKGFCDGNAVNYMGYAASPLNQGVFFLTLYKNETLKVRDYVQALGNILKAILTRSDANLILRKKIEAFG